MLDNKFFKGQENILTDASEVEIRDMQESEVRGSQKNVLLLVGKKSNSGQASLEAIERNLKEHGHKILNNTSDDENEPTKVILKHRSADVVIVGGGDGSVNVALPGLLETKIPLLVLPLGTANNLARSLNLPTDINECLMLLQTGVRTRIDVGLVNKIPFVNVAGLGLSTEINRKTPVPLKRKIGVMAFVLTGLRLIFQMNPFRATIKTDDGKVVHSKSWQISVCNGKHYGAGMVIKHDATHDDRKLHLLSTEVQHWWKFFTLMPSVIKGRYNKNQEITLLEAHSFTIETHRTLHVDVDGDIKTQTPLKLEVLPQAIEVIVPV